MNSDRSFFVIYAGDPLRTGRTGATQPDYARLLLGGSCLVSLVALLGKTGLSALVVLLGRSVPASFSAPSHLKGCRGASGRSRTALGTARRCCTTSRTAQRARPRSPARCPRLRPRLSTTLRPLPAPYQQTLSAHSPPARGSA